jgi:adenylate cyclase
MASKIIKYLGIFTIILSCIVGMFLTMEIRNRANPYLYKNEKFKGLSAIEDAFYDLRMNKTRDKSAIDKRIALVAIDDYTIKKIGKWPFPRENHSKLLEKLKTFGAKTVAFDVFFSEDSLRCPGSNVDQEFANAISSFQEKPGNSVIVPYSLTTYPEEVFEEFPEDLYIYSLSARVSKDVGLVDKFVEKKVFPIPSLVNAGTNLAHLQVEPDLDGLMRHYQVVGNVDSQYLPGFSLAAYQAYTGDQPKVELLNYENYKLKLKTGDLPLNHGGEAKVRWIGGERNFPVIRFWDVLQASDDDPKMKELLNGNIIFIGSTAFAANDLRHTPVDPIMPGVLFHMNMTHMLLEGMFFKPTLESERLSWTLLLIGTLLILIIQFFGNAIIDVAGLVAIVAGLLIYDLKVLTPEGYEIKLFFILLSVIGCYSWNTFLHFYLANKDKSFLKSAFGNYISPELIDEMYKSGEPPKLGGDSGVRTAFFTDIQGFSTFSEKLTATQLVELLNEYLTHMTDILLEEGGTLDKYEGDAIIAFFGAPMELIDHAERANLVAHRMQERLAELRLKWASEGDKWPVIVHEMRMRVGINSGEIVTGNMGSASRMNYTMMGDAVNLAARLEESAKQYGIFTQVAEDSVVLAGDRFLFREVDTVKVVGKSVPVKSFDLLGLKETAPEFLLNLAKLFSEALEHYKAQRFKEALELFTQTLELEHQRFPELKGIKTNPSEIYIERCNTYIATPPPPEWDGVWTLTSK